MSFNLDISQILQYAYNIFSSTQTVLYLFIGGSFAGFVLAKLMNLAR